MNRIGWLGLLLVAFLLGSIGFVFVLRGSNIPAPQGAEAIGRTTFRWVNVSRAEAMTDDEGDAREVVVHLWYPAEVEKDAAKAPYIPDLDQIGDALRASGEVNALEAFGLRFVQTHALADAPLSSTETTYPVLLFSPGNLSNSAFYTTLVEAMVSNGFVVAAMDHPYDAAAVQLSNGQVASFAAEQWPTLGTNRDGNGVDDHMRFSLTRIHERALDAMFVLNQLEELNREGGGRFGGRFNLEEVGIFGHSLGGIAAARACALDQRFRACANVDGLYAASPFYPNESNTPFEQPFMLVTKEDGRAEPPDEALAAQGITREEWRSQRAAAHARVTALYESIRGGSYQVVIPSAAHESFSDGPTLLPSFLNRGEAEADRILRITSDYLTAFFDETLQGNPSALLDAPSPDYPEVLFEAYPKGTSTAYKGPSAPRF